MKNPTILVAAGDFEAHVQAGNPEEQARALEGALNEGVGPLCIGRQVVDLEALGPKPAGPARLILEAECRRASFETVHATTWPLVPQGSPLHLEIEAALDVDRELPSLGLSLHPDGSQSFTLSRVRTFTGRFASGEGYDYTRWSSAGAKL